jgi:hypothetical protein
MQPLDIGIFGPICLEGSAQDMQLHGHKRQKSFSWVERLDLYIKVNDDILWGQFCLSPLTAETTWA